MLPIPVLNLITVLNLSVLTTSLNFARFLPDLFWQAVGKDFRTRLLMGGSEPSYHPGTAHAPATIVYAHGFFASALHEIAHWCVAGRRRCQLHDFGYWYEPDGRPVDRQQAFEAAEITPQALEKLFHHAAGTVFHASADNIAAGPADAARFAAAVTQRANIFWATGMPPRARRWYDALLLARQAGGLVQ